MFGRLKIYTVHARPDNAEEPPVLVREGFNFLAFLFTFLWAFYHRLWLPGFFLFLANAFLLGVGHAQIMTPESLLIIQLAFQIVVGFQANDWLRAGLARRGYAMQDVAAAANRLAAGQRYFERVLSATPQ